MTPFTAVMADAVGPKAPAIAAALAHYPAATARRAARLIRALLVDTAGAAAGSRLTGDGFPLELAFAADDPGRLRFTVDPRSGGSDDEHEGRYAGSSVVRLWCARQQLRTSGFTAKADPDARRERSLWAALADMQRQGPLSWGSWIGARVDDASAVAKVYVEVPPGGRLPAACWQAPRVPDREVVARMVGYTPSSGTVETYYRVPSLSPRAVVAVLAPAGLERQATATLEFIERSYGWVLRGRLPGPSVGVSYAVTPGEPVRVTLYFFARSLWGSDARIRSSFARAVEASRGSAAAYLAVSAPLASRKDWRTRHGLVGFTVTREREAVMPSIGLRPVASVAAPVAGSAERPRGTKGRSSP